MAWSDACGIMFSFSLLRLQEQATDGDGSCHDSVDGRTEVRRGVPVLQRSAAAVAGRGRRSSLASDHFDGGDGGLRATLQCRHECGGLGRGGRRLFRCLGDHGGVYMIKLARVEQILNSKLVL